MENSSRNGFDNRLEIPLHTPCASHFAAVLKALKPLFGYPLYLERNNFFIKNAPRRKVFREHR